MIREKIRRFAPDDEFVCFSLPGEKHYHVHAISSVEYTKSLKYMGDCDFVWAPFDRSEHPVCLLRLEEPEVNRVFAFRPHTAQEGIHTTKSEYMEQFDKAYHHLQSGRLDKIVLSRVKEQTINGSDTHVCDYFRNLVSRYPDAFVYLIHLNETGCWAGATPEILLTGERGEYRTVALAGTLPIDEDQTSIIWTAKEREEQDIIVRYIEGVLEGYDVPFSHSKCFTVRAGKMAHLKTVFKMGDMEEIHKVISGLHPGPALSGFPKEEAMNIIRKIELHERRYYTGFLGPVYSRENFKFFVNLRCMELFYDRLRLYLGGGLILASQAEAEWAETELKATTLLEGIKKSESLNPNTGI